MLGHLMINVFLALLWCLLVEEFSGKQFLLGYLVGAGLMFVLRRLLGETCYFHKLKVLVKLIGVFVYDLVVANLQVALLICRPRLRIRPALFHLPLELESDAAITTLANMISLTPGTLTVDVTPDRRCLVIHALDVADLEDTKRSIKERFERPLRELEQ
jgi:multicomponent Na+:H+ antiporter subunit E